METNLQEEETGLMQNRLLHMVLVALLGLAVYSNTFSSPFVLDDDPLIIKNPIVRSTQYILEPSAAEGFADYGYFRRRHVGFATFIFNYRFGGLDVRGYHAVNIALHIVNALLLYAFVLVTLRTPKLKYSRIAGHSRPIALLCALIFVAHPLNTEAVNYIYQRVTLLAFFFYMSTFIMYTRARMSSGPGAAIMYLFALASACLAALSKENALTLPIAVGLYEMLFFTGPWLRRVFTVLPVFLSLVLYLAVLGQTGLSLGTVLVGAEREEVAESVAASTFEADYMDPSRKRLTYLLTQPRVIATYVRLMFLPVNQNFLYDYPRQNSALSVPVISSGLFLALLIIASVYLIYRSRRREAALALAGFGVLWFFITLFVESSVIPLPLLISEYRAYLPMAGVIVSLLSGAWLLAERFQLQTGKNVLAVLSLIVVLALSASAYGRNSVWQSEVSLWEDVVKKSPRNPVAHSSLAVAYSKEGRHEEAIGIYRSMLEAMPYSRNVLPNMADLYYLTGRFDEALKYYRKAASVYIDSPDILVKQGLIYEHKGEHTMALSKYSEAIRLFPRAPVAYEKRGSLRLGLGDRKAAASDFKAACSFGHREACDKLKQLRSNK